MDVDDTDRRIVNAVLAESSTNSTDLSQATGLSVPVVERRLDSLERAGVVDDAEPTVDYDALGFDVTAVVEITVEDGEHDAVVEHLEGVPQMITVYLVTGECDVVAVGKYRSLSALNEGVGALLTTPSVRDVTTTVVREAIREGGQFPLERDD